MKSIISILQEKKDLIDHWIQQRKKIKKVIIIHAVMLLNDWFN